MEAVPMAMALIKPFSTVATAGLLLVHVTVLSTPLSGNTVAVRGIYSTCIEFNAFPVQKDASKINTDITHSQFAPRLSGDGSVSHRDASQFFILYCGYLGVAACSDNSLVRRIRRGNCCGKGVFFACSQFKEFSVERNARNRIVFFFTGRKDKSLDCEHERK
jgi:hypothetical protein